MPSQQMPSPLKTDISLSSLKSLKLKRPQGVPSFLSGHLSFKRRRTAVIGLDIQPGYIAAVRARMNGSVVVEQAAAVALPADTVREGEVLNQEALAGALRELFAGAGLDKHVRIGVANQRTVMRTLEVPPLSDQKELAAAVRFQAEDQVPMPLNNAVLDFRPLGVVDTPEGARQRVLLVAAQRDMIDKLLVATKAAGLHAEGVDLSAFALIRSLYRADRQQGENGPSGALYLNVGGLTNMAIAEGTTCRFTRVLARGLEAIASEVAERRAVPIDQARELLRRINLSAIGDDPHGSVALIGSEAQAAATALVPQADQQLAEAPAPVEEPGVHGGAGVAAPGEGEAGAGLMAVPDPTAEQGAQPAFEQPAAPAQVEAAGESGAEERPTLTVVGDAAEDTGGVAAGPPSVDAMHVVEGAAGAAEASPEGLQAGAAAPGAIGDPAAGVGEPGVADQIAAVPAETTGEQSEGVAAQPVAAQPVAAQPVAAPAVVEDLSDVRLVLESGVRDIAGEVRNTLDFYQAQEQGVPVAVVFLSGPALDIPGFGEMLEQNLGVPVHGETVSAISAEALSGISPQYLAIAAGLAIDEVGS
jgi:type IV pilus assembly protein PilM